MTTENTTTDHDTIRQWAEARSARPARVRDTGSGDDPGILRFDFPFYAGGEEGPEVLEEVTWDTFFDKFEAENLALVYQEQTADGETSNFNKLISRETANQR